MAFIKNESKLGKVVAITEDISTLLGTFEKGTIMKIVEIGDRGYTLVDIEGNFLREAGFSRFKDAEGF